VKTFATKGGALERVVGPEGGSVKIQKANRRFQEKRTYPGSHNPKSRRGRRACQFTETVAKRLHLPRVGETAIRELGA